MESLGPGASRPADTCLEDTFFALKALEDSLLASLPTNSSGPGSLLWPQGALSIQKEKWLWMLPEQVTPSCSRCSTQVDVLQQRDWDQDTPRLSH